MIYKKKQKIDPKLVFTQKYEEHNTIVMTGTHFSTRQEDIFTDSPSSSTS